MKSQTIFQDLSGKSVLVTGGASGIGSYLVEGFVRQGAKVAFIDINEEAGQAHADAMNAQHGTRPIFQTVDVRDIAALQAAVANIADAQGGLDVLVNNAADDTRHAIDTVTAESWDNAMAINLRPHFFTAQTAAPIMKTAGGGAIVNYSSISYVLAQPDYPAYTTAKAGIVALTRSLARAFGPDNIRVNAILPGWVMTERQKRLWVTDETRRVTMEGQCLKEFMQPEDMVDPTLFLASDASRMMTAQTMTVDGGWT